MGGSDAADIRPFGRPVACGGYCGSEDIDQARRGDRPGWRCPVGVVVSAMMLPFKLASKAR